MRRTGRNPQQSINTPWIRIARIARHVFNAYHSVGRTTFDGHRHPSPLHLLLFSPGHRHPPVTACGRFTVPFAPSPTVGFATGSGRNLPDSPDGMKSCVQAVLPQMMPWRVLSIHSVAVRGHERMDVWSHTICCSKMTAP